MHDTLDQISRYLRGHKVPMRADDPRQWAEYLDTVVRPQLDELARLQAAAKPKKQIAVPA
jgi:hypothetical protein